jgi:hypothetical protein
MDINAVRRIIRLNPQIRFGSGVTSDQLLIAEAQLDLSVKGGYRSFLEEFGWLDAGEFEVYGLGDDVPRHLNLVNVTLSERSVMNPPLLPSLIPVMNDGGGNLYCVDAGPVRNGAVLFWDHELGSDQEPDFVASSFNEWLNQRLLTIDQ